MRRAGSARFDPYFKVQRWEPRSACWVDIQRAFPSEEAARAQAARLAGKTRVMRISEEGRSPLASPGEEE